jgi:hypothetical protein
VGSNTPEIARFVASISKTRKAEKVALRTAPIAQLIEDLFAKQRYRSNGATPYEEREGHVKNVEAHVDEIARQDSSPLYF